MRMGWMIAAAAAAAMLAPLPAAAADWYRVSKGSIGTYYLDADSIVNNGQWTVARQVVVFDTVADGGGKSSASDLEVDCAARAMRFVRFTLFDSANAELGKLDWPDERKLHPHTPGTIFGIVGDFICGGSRAEAVRVADPYTDTSR